MAVDRIRNVSGENERLPETMDIGQLVPALSGGGWRQGVRGMLHCVLGLYQTNALFARARDVESAGGDNLFLGVLEERKMALDCGDLPRQIPAEGPVVVIANHPFGGADAIALTGVCAGVRADARVLANAMSSDLPGMDKWAIPLHIMGEEGSTSMNRQAMKSALAHLRAGGLLVVFPAGAVSRWRDDLGRVADPGWSPHIVRLIIKTRASVVPVRFFGRNPVWFEMLGAIHPLLRSALIIRAFLAAGGKPVRFRASLPISHDVLADKTAEDATEILRATVERVEEP